jgi:hypothetical protein
MRSSVGGWCRHACSQASWPSEIPTRNSCRLSASSVPSWAPPSELVVEGPTDHILCCSRVQPDPGWSAKGYLSGFFIASSKSRTSMVLHQVPGSKLCQLRSFLKSRPPPPWHHSIEPTQWPRALLVPPTSEKRLDLDQNRLESSESE